MFRKFYNKKKKFDVIGIGDIIQFIGGKAYQAKKVEGVDNNDEHTKVYLETYRGYHPVPFPGDKPYENRSWESIRHLNYEMEQKLDSIYSLTKTKYSEKPDFYYLSKEEAHQKAIESVQSKYK